MVSCETCELMANMANLANVKSKLQAHLGFFCVKEPPKIPNFCGYQLFTSLHNWLRCPRPFPPAPVASPGVCTCWAWSQRDRPAADLSGAGHILVFKKKQILVACSWKCIGSIMKIHEVSYEQWIKLDPFNGKPTCNQQHGQFLPRSPGPRPENNLFWLGSRNTS